MGTLAPGGIRRRLLHHPAAFTLAMLAYVGVAFAIEPFAGRGGEVAIGATTWLVLLAAVRSSPPSERAQVAAVVLIATAGEILGSLILGLYEYRRGGIPAFVPPGHGLVYLAGCRLARSPFVRAHAFAVVRIAIAGAAVWALGGLALGSRPDVAGALTGPACTSPRPTRPAASPPATAPSTRSRCASGRACDALRSRRARSADGRRPC